MRQTTGLKPHNGFSTTGLTERCEHDSICLVRKQTIRPRLRDAIKLEPGHPAEIGDTPATVRKKYGRKNTVDTERESGEITWYYEMNEYLGPGTTSVVFKNGKVSMIASSYQVC